jgi:leukotriene-A4 hydrolase
LYYLANQVVGSTELFEQFLSAYFTKFANQSLTSQDMKKFFLEHFADKVDANKLNSVDWELWWTTEGLPPVDNKFDSKLATNAINLANKIVTENGQNATASDIEGWSSTQLTYFLETLSKLTKDKGLDHDVLKRMDAAYNFTAVKNAEIRFRWLSLCLASSYEPVYDQVVAMLSDQGRMKFTRPLYVGLNKAKNGRELAVQTFKKNKDSYHLICARMVAKDLQVEW